MGQAFSHSQQQHESNSDRPPPATDDSSAWSTAVDGGRGDSPSISSRRRVLRSPLSSRGTRRPNPLRYEPPPPTDRGVQPPEAPTRLLTRLQQRLRRPTTASGSEASSLVSPAESMMDIDTPLPEDSSINGSEGETASGEEDASQSTLSRLLTEVITSAVLDSLNQPGEGQQEDAQEDAQGEEGSSQNGPFQLPRELFPATSAERSSELGSFFRMLRMPASTLQSTGETMPVFIIGYRATRSREEEGGRRWVIYIISGSSQHIPASLFSDNPSYEDLMMLSHFLGPVRPVTATAQQIETIPITIYRKDQMTEMINDKCQVCLEDYAESQELRMLQCKHGFHKDCIDRWLTEGRNCCPICRGVPVPHAEDA
ncbi:hypothetical protein INT44_001614 [Umbelopsis vinacea]|uniref:RING-type domain-containing protein n=1 Tax=Umbelopsis vinacea TaxID=44442 RepID=A0A8H7UEB6_9FUNG|nr:hypothetical protein INT44_001614 [Umbelopsis vinacea]